MKANKIYNAIAPTLERLERKGVLGIPAHGLAQRLTSIIEYELLPHETKKIVGAMIRLGGYATAKEIAQEARIRSKTVSAQLMQLQYRSPLVVSKPNGRLKNYSIASIEHFSGYDTP